MTRLGDLNDIERFYMALADGTRLRLLNLMRENEVCVCFFTEVLGESQPKISRHLAYLRNAGLVEARRDGKWMHYSIVWPENEGARRALESTLDMLAERKDMQIDLNKYDEVCCTPELLVQIARTPIDFIEPPRSEPEQETEPAPIQKSIDAPVRRTERETAAAHNELEEYLL
jgi:ArsR family transcriptional regulator, arsenate/arsenite/antimonite-responsive transcriptional repressor